MDPLLPRFRPLLLHIQSRTSSVSHPCTAIPLHLHFRSTPPTHTRYVHTRRYKGSWWWRHFSTGSERCCMVLGMRLWTAIVLQTMWMPTCMGSTQYTGHTKLISSTPRTMGHCESWTKRGGVEKHGLSKGQGEVGKCCREGLGDLEIGPRCV